MPTHAHHKDLTLYCDGASRGNPGPGACGYVIFENNKILAQEGILLGNVTNNVAEYEGLIKGLEKAIELGGTSLTIKSDSQLLVRQLNGQYAIRNRNLITAAHKAKSLLSKFERVKILHIPREENSLADSLCNESLDGA